METAQGKKYKILVVDDNNENIRIIGSILRQNAFKVGFATGGQQALEILNENREDYDMVLLDVNMPGINGFEVCRTMRKNHSLKELPVIFLTANAEPEHIIEGFNSGGQDYVTKPFHYGELLSRINTHLELKESRRQLQQMNTILEEKVKQRTLELEEANKNLAAANKELEKLDETKAEFLRLISHEINTPLNGIIGFTDLLKELLLDTEYFGFIENLSESASRLNEFAQSSLLVTELRTSPQNFKFEPIEIQKAIEEALKILNVNIKQRNISLQVSFQENIPLIKANFDLVKTSMVYLLKNAILHTPLGQTLKINIEKEFRSVLLTIEDSGPGFSEKALQNLFKPFVTGNKHIDNDTGLSLHLVKMIVDFHQAKIEVSNWGNGARVIMSFPTIDNS